LKKTLFNTAGMFCIVPAFVMVVLSCASVTPMATAITNRMSGNEASIPQYQYYVSRNIVLTLYKTISGEAKSSVTASGVAKVVDDSLQVSKSTPCIVPQAVPNPYERTEDEKLMIGVVFEDDDEKRLWFIQDDTGAQSKFHFAWVTDAGAENVIRYGDAYYTVTWDFKGAKFKTRWQAFWLNVAANWKGFFQGTNVSGAENEPPYLLIKMKTDENLRGARGRTIQ
jgi:hypothetical protein